jgi:hypothetical protein
MYLLYFLMIHLQNLKFNQFIHVCFIIINSVSFIYNLNLFLVIH